MLLCSNLNYAKNYVSAIGGNCFIENPGIKEVERLTGTGGKRVALGGGKTGKNWGKVVTASIYSFVIAYLLGN